jgi:uncharacterized membrane protein YdcZ (DUF606 family)
MWTNHLFSMSIRDFCQNTTYEFTVALSVLVGCLMVVQATVNIHLSNDLGSGIRSSCISFWLGFIITQCAIRSHSIQDIMPQSKVSHLFYHGFCMFNCADFLR